MLPIIKLERFESFQYDGTNGADIRDQLNAYTTGSDPWTIISESGGVLHVRNTVNSENIFVPELDHLVLGQRDSAFVLGVMTETQLGNNYVDLVTEIGNTVLASNAQAMGVAVVPALTASGSTTVQVTVGPPLPDTSYAPAAVLIGGASLLGSLSITSTTAVSTTRVDVVVQNTGLLTISGASVLVIAIDQ